MIPTVVRWILLLGLLYMIWFEVGGWTFTLLALMGVRHEIEDTAAALRRRP